MLSWQPALPSPGMGGAVVLQMLPFLPAGRGALILMLGGLLVLPISLLMSRVGAPAAPARAARQPMAFIPVPAGSGGPALQMGPPAAPWNAPAAHPERPWTGTGIERAIRRAVGGTQLLAAAPGHYVVRLGRCDSCRRRIAGCERERVALERAVAPYLEHAHVTERACGQRGRHEPCSFDIRGR